MLVPEQGGLPEARRAELVESLEALVEWEVVYLIRAPMSSRFGASSRAPGMAAGIIAKNVHT
ncbi:MAG: hypothetical protein J2P58_05695 [Acidimicrobiaceae bacterium]|nr:hypothetical protein [Acidimicrobiaceae bacterium]